MFVLSQSQTYVWPVKVEFPVSGGRFETQTFDVEFKRLPQSRIREIGKQIEASEITDIELSREVMAGWKGVNDERGAEVPFSESARDDLLDVSMVAAAVVRAYFESLAGAKRKN